MNFFDNSKKKKKKKNEAENVFMMLNELFVAFQINFHHHKFSWLQIFTFKNCMTN